MAGQPTPPWGDLNRRFADIEARLQAVEHQQTFVITDPTGATGDPSHGHATVVIGNLKPITGISAFGIASYKTGAWVQL